MKSKPELSQYIARRGVVTSKELTDRGYARETLHRLARQEKLHRVARGIYISNEVAKSPHRDLLIVSGRVSQGVICLLSALAYHGLTTEMPHEVWLGIGLKDRAPRQGQPPINLVRLSPDLLRDGVERHEHEGVTIQVTSPARTVADCFKFRSRVGLDVAIAALSEGWNDRRFTMDEIWRFARICRVATVIRPYMEALTH
ncbi:MAG: type IV toxin-antitoxin system AbiEi family antitoxin domain-containing protein [Acidobacteria bacterium]|nr:type IV toxin-antitoxin system AbiEi family antitoxin domain-containing protein [Acidobacteriota bacterium]